MRYSNSATAAGHSGSDRVGRRERPRLRQPVGVVFGVAVGGEQDASGAGPHLSAGERQRCERLARARPVPLEVLEEPELHLDGQPRVGLARIVAHAPQHLLVHRPRLVEAALARHLGGEGAARRGIVRVGLDHRPEDLLSFLGAPALEKHRSQQAAGGPILGPAAGQVARLRFGFRELPGAREIEDDALGDRGVGRIAALQVAQDLERLVELVLLFVEIDEGRGDLAVPAVGLVERAVDLLGLARAPGLGLGLGGQALDHGLIGELRKLVEHRRGFGCAVGGEQRAGEADRASDVRRREPPGGREVLDRGVEPRGILLGRGEVEGAEQALCLRERGVETYGLARLLLGLRDDVQVAKKLGVLETHDRVVRHLLEHLPVERERFLVSPLRDGGARGEEGLSAGREARLSNGLCRRSGIRRLARR